ncbi:MAG: hypothetical protein ACFB0C_24410 [Leptolyngbyaceae cyanobacterium]
MKTKDLLKEIEELGSGKVKRQSNQQDAHENQFGVQLGDIRKAAKKAKKSNSLALEPWKTGNIVFISRYATSDSSDTKSFLASRVDALLHVHIPCMHTHYL